MLSDNTIKQIALMFCGDTEGYYSYKSGPKLVEFFNTTASFIHILLATCVKWMAF